MVFGPVGGLYAGRGGGEAEPQGHARKPSKAAKRFWELSGGILRCGECGHTLRPHNASKKSGGRFHYYSCRPGWPLEITGVFAEVGEEAEAGLSKCKLSQLSV
jgi:hypothetical protein